MKKILALIVAQTVLVQSAFSAPKVVTTIKPLHSLTSQIMEGVGKPEYLIKQGSPHGYQLKPSDAKKIANADLFVWVSDDLETFAPKIADKVGSKLESLTWAEIKNLNLLPNRKGGLWDEKDDDDDHDHHDHHHKEQNHHHKEHEHHHHGAFNTHLWLGFDQSKQYLKAFTNKISQIDPTNAEKYQANLKNAENKLTNLELTLSKKLAASGNKPYVVFHDAYGYFEQAFPQLKPVGVVRVDPEHEAGAKRLLEIKKTLKQNNIYCLFNEPQFSSRLTKKLLEGTTVKTGVLDPVGADIPAGVNMHEKLLTNLADNLQKCLN